MATTTLAGQPLDQLVRTLDLIQDEHDHQPQFFKANHDMHAPRLLEIAQALRAELAEAWAATETNREIARTLLDELAAVRAAIAAHTRTVMYLNQHDCDHPQPDQDDDEFDAWSDNHPVSDDGRICLLSPTDETTCSTCTDHDGEPLLWELCSIGKLAKP